MHPGTELNEDDSYSGFFTEGGMPACRLAPHRLRVGEFES